MALSLGASTVARYSPRGRRSGKGLGKGEVKPQEGLKELRRLLASSPSPPKWAEPSLLDESSHSTKSLGKWGRGSLVGAGLRP